MKKKSISKKEMNKQNFSNWSKMKTQNLFFVKTCDEQLINFISKHNAVLKL